MTVVLCAMPQHAGEPPGFAIPTLLNASGPTGLASMLWAMLIGENEQVIRIIDAQYAHLDCLPPLRPTPPPSRSTA